MQVGGVFGQVPGISKIISAALIQPSYVRLVVEENSELKVYWVGLAVLQASRAKAGGNDFDRAASMAIAACAGQQAIFDSFEIDFVFLMQIVEDFGLGYVHDMRAPQFQEPVVEVSFAVDKDRLCLHSLSTDGMTRLFIARRSADREEDREIEFRLEFFSANDDFELVRSACWPEDVIDPEERPVLLSWMLSCISGPLTPAPIAH